MSKPRILYTPIPEHTGKVFSGETFKQLLETFDVTLNENGVNYTISQVAYKIRGYDGLITGWGAAPLTEEVFKNADRLRIITHSAGSVKYMLSREVFERYIVPKGICVFSARESIAYNVAESTIGYLIMGCRRFTDHALAFREHGIWRDPRVQVNGQFLMGSIVGVIGASKVGREVIRLLKTFDVRILLYDPYVSESEAERLGVEKNELNVLLSRADFVTLHAPLTPETYRMIGEKELKLIKDGALLVNTSRGGVIDYKALIQECTSSRIYVVLDVTDPEPLPADSPLRHLSNVIITPHISGAGYYGYFRIGASTLKALQDFFAGKPVEGAVKLEEYDIMA